MKKVFMIAMVLMFGLSIMAVSNAIAEDCGPPGVGSPGYWKNHPDAWPDGIQFCGEALDYTEAIELMGTPVRGDKWLTLFRAWVAAKLNIAIGNPRPEDCCKDDIEVWLCAYEDSVAASSEAWQCEGEDFYLCLDDYNNGFQDGAPSRDALE